MQRLVSLYAGSQAGACRNVHTRGGWPYSPTSDANQQPVASSRASSSPVSHQAISSRRSTTSAVTRAVSELIEQIRHMKGIQDVWEVAVKRNGMTTSLALLGGVLFADMLLYHPSGKRQAMLQASLASHGSSRDGSSSGGSSSSSGGGSDTSSSSQQPGRSTEPLPAGPRLTAPGAMPAHA